MSDDMAVFKGEIERLENLITDLATKTESTSYKSSLLPVGSMVFSPLSLAKWQEAFGLGWVACRGQKVPGSAYESMGYGSKVPSSDVYYRIAKNDAELGTKLEDSTSGKDLDFNITSFKPGKVTLKKTLTGKAKSASANIKMHCDTRPPARGQGGDWHFYSQSNNALRAEISGISGTHSLIGADPNEGQLMGHGGQQIFKDLGHSHEISVDLNESVDVEGASLSCSISSKASETRPKTYVLNAFIRIN